VLSPPLWTRTTNFLDPATSEGESKLRTFHLFKKYME
jgi:hypothetical protein